MKNLFLFNLLILNLSLFSQTLTGKILDTKHKEGWMVSRLQSKEARKGSIPIRMVCFPSSCKLADLTQWEGSTI